MLTTAIVLRLLRPLHGRYICDQWHFTITISCVNLFILMFLTPIAGKGYAVECKIRFFVTQGYSCGIPRAFRMQVNRNVVEPMQGYFLRPTTRARTGVRSLFNTQRNSDSLIIGRILSPSSSLSDTLHRLQCAHGLVICGARLLGRIF